jgi:hypothetical protein
VIVDVCDQREDTVCRDTEAVRIVEHSIGSLPIGGAYGSCPCQSGDGGSGEDNVADHLVVGIDHQGESLIRRDCNVRAGLELCIGSHSIGRART